MKYLDGKKTYICALVAAVAAALGEIGYLEQSDFILKGAAALGLICLRSGIKNSK